jgi:IclR family acetate operon transcriptional repressor
VAPDGTPSQARGGALRTLRVLEALAGMAQPSSLDAIAATMNMTQSATYRALRSLQEQGFVDHAGRTGYRLGSRSIALAYLIGTRPAFLADAVRVVRRLAAATSRSAAMHLRSGSHRVLVVGVDSPIDPLARAAPIGERAPLTSGCSGVAILAFLPTTEAQAVIAGRPSWEPRPDTAQLDVVRQAGVAMSFSDNHVDMHGIGAPLLDPDDGYPLGSLTLAGPAAKLPEAALQALQPALVGACDDLAGRLATVLGHQSSTRLKALDVTIRSFLDQSRPAVSAELSPAAT